MKFITRLLSKISKSLTTKKSRQTNISENSQKANFKEQLMKLGVEFPKIPDSESRKAYLDFLNIVELSEKDVLPIMDLDKITPEMRATALMGLIQAIEKNDKKLIQTFGLIASWTIANEDNSNIVLYQITENLKQNLIDKGLKLPPFYAGIFPTSSFNAQCRYHLGNPLILMDTGCMEIISATVTSFFAKIPDYKKIDEIGNSINTYINSNKYFSAMDVTSEGVDWGGGITSIITTKAEEFILLHEIGHFVLGHLSSSKTRSFNPAKGKNFDIIENDLFKEFQADIWACKFIIENVKKSLVNDKSEVIAALLGPAVGLGIAMLIENAKTTAGVTINDSHPPAFERIYFINLLYEILGVHEATGGAVAFLKLVDDVSEEFFPNTETTPYLSRDLNKKLIPVLDSLDIDYSNVNFLKDFK